MVCTYPAIAHAHALSTRRAQAMKVAFQGEERDLEHSIDHEVHTFAAVLDVSVDPSNRVLTPLLTLLLITDTPIRRSITIFCRSKRTCGPYSPVGTARWCPCSV